METNIETLKGRIKKLIGVEPEHLHHVLQAIEKKAFIGLQEQGIIPTPKRATRDSILTLWNLTLPLSGQNDDTINFLLELIK